MSVKTVDSSNPGLNYLCQLGTTVNSFRHRLLPALLTKIIFSGDSGNLVILNVKLYFLSELEPSFGSCIHEIAHHTPKFP